MLLPDKVYDVMKWVTVIALPAAGTAYFGLAQIWNFPLGEEVVGTVAVVTLLLGTLLGISTKAYNAATKEPTYEDL